MTQFTENMTGKNKLEDEQKQLWLLHSLVESQLLEKHGELALPIMAAFKEADYFAKTHSSSVDISTYNDVVYKYSHIKLIEIYLRSRFTGAIDDPLTLKWDIAKHNSVDASIFLDENNTAIIEISMGTFHALQDAILRALSSEDFFNVHHTDENGENRWKGCRCWQPVLVSPPFKRYIDYDEGAELDKFAKLFKTQPKLFKAQLATSLNDTTLKPSYIGRYLKKIPRDSSRLQLAYIMQDIAIAWVFLHEESHARCGHLHYMEKRYKSSNLVAKYRMSESKNKDESYLSDEASRVFEWQADRHATEGVIDVFFNDELIMNAMPSYAKGNWLWLFQLIVSAIGVVIVVLDQVRIYKGCPASYPSPKVRLAALLRTAYYHFLKKMGISIHSHDFLNRFANNDEIFSNSLPAIYSTLNSIHSLNELVRTEENLELDSYKPLLPKDEFAPHVTGAVYYFSMFGITDIFDSGDMEAARAAKNIIENHMTSIAKHYNVSRDELRDAESEALQVTEELDELVSLNDRKYWPDLLQFHKQCHPIF